MNENQAYVIQIISNERKYYLGQKDGVTSRIRSAKFYTDETQVLLELDRINNDYKESPNGFLNNPNNIFLKKVEINLI